MAQTGQHHAGVCSLQQSPRMSDVELKGITGLVEQRLL